MNHSASPTIPLEKLAAVELPIAAASGMPNESYTDPALFEFERDHVFAPTWAALGFCDSFSTPGFVTPVEFMGLPLLVTCDKAGDLRVFHNVCSHRGMRLVKEGRKTSGLLVCPYHSWTYSLQGELRATPHIGGVGINSLEGFACKNNGLKPVRSHTWMGVLMINLCGDARPFEQHIAPLAQRYLPHLGDDGLSLLDTPDFDGEMELEVRGNWKLAVENFCEAYHLPWIHPGLNSYSPLSEHYGFEIEDGFSGQGTSTFTPVLHGEVSLPVFPAWPQEKQSIAEYPIAYPNLLLGFQVNHVFALVIHPLAANRVREELRLFYVGEGAKGKAFEACRRSNLDAWRKVFEEDIIPVEGMQQGRNSPGYSGGAFSPVMDTVTHHFHKWVARRYRNGLYPDSFQAG